MLFILKPRQPFCFVYTICTLPFMPLKARKISFHCINHAINKYRIVKQLFTVLLFNCYDNHLLIESEQIVHLHDAMEMHGFH